jgi:hypothetical protein
MLRGKALRMEMGGGEPHPQATGTVKLRLRRALGQLCSLPAPIPGGSAASSGPTAAWDFGMFVRPLYLDLCGGPFLSKCQLPAILQCGRQASVSHRIATAARRSVALAVNGSHWPKAECPPAFHASSRARLSWEPALLLQRCVAFMEPSAISSSNHPIDALTPSCPRLPPLHYAHRLHPACLARRCDLRAPGSPASARLAPDVIGRTEVVACPIRALSHTASCWSR